MNVFENNLKAHNYPNVIGYDKAFDHFKLSWNFMYIEVARYDVTMKPNAAPKKMS